MAELDKTITLATASAAQTYCNGFTVNLSNADVNLVLLWNNGPVSTVSMSFTTAKTLTAGLSAVIKQLEEASGREIMDIDTVSRVIQEMVAKRDDKHE